MHLHKLPMFVHLERTHLGYIKTPEKLKFALFVEDIPKVISIVDSDWF